MTPARAEMPGVADTHADLLRDLAVAPDEETVLRSLCTGLLAHLGMDRSSLFVEALPGGLRPTQAGAGGTPTEVLALATASLRSGPLALCGSVAHLPLATAAGCQYVAVPIPISPAAPAPPVRRVLVLWARRPRSFAGLPLAAVTRMADVAGSALCRIAVTGAAADARDGLTNLANRRAWESEFPAECGRSVRYDRPLSLAIVDLDHFKRVNDSLGHPVGDVVLRTVGAILGGAVRGSDRVYRLGGEEFCILLPDTAAASGTLLAERVRAAVEAHFIAHPISLSPPMPITASVGIAQLDPSMATSDDLYRAADAALYAAKERGRNCVVMAHGDGKAA